MAGTTRTKARDNRLPAGFETAVRKYCVYGRWTVEEAANLLCGCLPERELFMRGAENRTLDDTVVDMENRIRTALGNRITRLTSKRYFDKTWVPAADVIDWARRESIDLPEVLLDVFESVRAETAQYGYRTPCMAAVDWAVLNFWQDADLRDPPTPGEIVSALLQAFPGLSPEECEMVEYIARHPAARSAGVP